MTRSKLILVAALSLVLASCTSYRAYQQGREHEILKEWDKAVIAYSKALDVDPENMKYRMALQEAKREASRLHFDRGKELMAAGQHELAALEFEVVVQLDPSNQFAAVELGKAIDAARMAELNQTERTLEEKKRRARMSKAQPPELNPASLEPISLSFPRPTPVKEIYRALGNAYGINIVFDQAVKDDERISIELADVTAQQALERVMQAADHFYKVLDEKTLIVVPDNPQTRRDYEDLVIQTFYLSNGDAEQVTNVVRTMIEARNVFPLKALNAITIRDTADKVKIAEKIIEANDKARAEVVVQVELLQMDAKKLRDIGVEIGLNITQGFSPVDAAGAAITGPFRISQLRNVTSDSWTFNVPNVAYKLLKSRTDAQLLARPQLRISEGEKATLHIGQQVPVPVSTVNPITTPGQTAITPITSYQYRDVGIKISIEPRVHHNREVTLKLIVEVSNLQGAVKVPNQPDQPIIGTRTIESTIRLKDGETNFLAGLIRKDDATSETTVPFLGDLPVIGRLFSSNSKDVQTTDLVLTMTPHIIRIPDITEEDLAPMWVGTSNNLTFRGVSPRIESAVGADPFTPPAQPGEAQPAPAFGFPGQNEVAPPPRAPQPEIPGGRPPADPFRRPQEEPDPQASLDSRSHAAAAAASLAPAPRIAPQPSSLRVAPGQEAHWKIVGMDLEGIRTAEIRIFFDPMALDIVNVVAGSALQFDPLAPPAVSIDRAGGSIRVTSSDGSPLQFRSGGEILDLVVRGGVTGDTMLVVQPMKLVNRNDEIVAPSISGGRARVE